MQEDTHPDHLRRLLRDGKVKGEQFSQVWMIDPAEVERIKALQGPGGRPPRSEPRKSWLSLPAKV